MLVSSVWRKIPTIKNEQINTQTNTKQAEERDSFGERSPGNPIHSPCSNHTIIPAALTHIGKVGLRATGGNSQCTRVTWGWANRERERERETETETETERQRDRERQRESFFLHVCIYMGFAVQPVSLIDNHE